MSDYGVGFTRDNAVVTHYSSLQAAVSEEIGRSVRIAFLLRLPYTGGH